MTDTPAANTAMTAQLAAMTSFLGSGVLGVMAAHIIVSRDLLAFAQMWVAPWLGWICLLLSVIGAVFSATVAVKIHTESPPQHELIRMAHWSHPSNLGYHALIIGFTMMTLWAVSSTQQREAGTPPPQQIETQDPVDAGLPMWE